MDIEIFFDYYKEKNLAEIQNMNKKEISILYIIHNEDGFDEAKIVSFDNFEIVLKERISKLFEINRLQYNDIKEIENKFKEYFFYDVFLDKVKAESSLELINNIIKKANEIIIELSKNNFVEENLKFLSLFSSCNNLKSVIELRDKKENNKSIFDFVNRVVMNNYFIKHSEMSISYKSFDNQEDANHWLEFQDLKSFTDKGFFLLNTDEKQNGNISSIINETIVFNNNSLMKNLDFFKVNIKNAGLVNFSSLSEDISVQLNSIDFSVNLFKDSAGAVIVLPYNVKIDETEVIEICHLDIRFKAIDDIEESKYKRLVELLKKESELFNPAHFEKLRVIKSKSNGENDFVYYAVYPKEKKIICTISNRDLTNEYLRIKEVFVNGKNSDSKSVNKKIEIKNNFHSNLEFMKKIFSNLDGKPLLIIVTNYEKTNVLNKELSAKTEDCEAYVQKIFEYIKYNNKDKKSENILVMPLTYTQGRNGNGEIEYSSIVKTNSIELLYEMSINNWKNRIFSSFKNDKFSMNDIIEVYEKFINKTNDESDKNLEMKKEVTIKFYQGIASKLKKSDLNNEYDYIEKAIKYLKNYILENQNSNIKKLLSAKKIIKIKCISGTMIGKTLVIDNDSILLMGRMDTLSDNLISLAETKQFVVNIAFQDSKYMSKNHCIIKYDNGFTLEDNNSLNGTFRGDGKKITETLKLKKGDKFYMANPENSFEVAEIMDVELDK